MSSRLAILNNNSSNVARILAVGGSLSWTVWNATDTNPTVEEKKDTSARPELSSSPCNNNNNNKTKNSIFINKLTNQNIDYLSTLFNPTVTSLEGRKGIYNDGNKSDNGRKGKEEEMKDKKIVSYDFIILGHGNAGQSALQTLRKRCPNAKIAVIDPLRSIIGTTADNATKKTTHYKETATRFNPKSRTVNLLSDPMTELQYKYGILVCTGSRGAPPPMELFEPSSLSRVLELRTTELLGNTKRPIMSPELVRKTVLVATSKGAKVAILGSGWEALDIVCAVEKLNKYSNKKPTIVFGNPGPVWNILPQYLSSELRKKLVKKDIDIQDRSIVRYVADTTITRNTTTTAPNDDSTTTNKPKPIKKLELHTAKTYDLLDTKRTSLDLLVVAPDSFGAKGTATLPTTEIPLRMLDSSDGRPWYKTWSQLTKNPSSSEDPSVIVCFEDDGRIAVNTELCAASKVYAAGSVAKYPNSRTGNSTIAGEGTVDGVEAGRVAAINMSHEYTDRNNYSAFSNMQQSSSSHESIESFASTSVPVWRSDITAYSGLGKPIISSLPGLGIQALCIGNCDSERLATRGFWWTNTSAFRKATRSMSEEEGGEEEDDGIINGSNSHGGTNNISSTNQNLDGARLVSRFTGRRRKNNNGNGTVTPIYGTGVVYYLDNNGRVRGILTWGLPFAKQVGGPMNVHLLSKLKHIIVSNAGVSALDAEENHQIMNNALARCSQKLVSIAVKGDDDDDDDNQHSSTLLDFAKRVHGLDGPIEGYSTPLYRFTEVAQGMNNKSVSVLKRKEGGNHGLLGEDLYARDEHGIEQETQYSEEEDGLTNIPQTMYPITVVPFQVEATYGQKAASLASLVELNRYLAIQRGWEENENRARPGKEDPLWLRPGDERKNVSRKQIIIDTYKQILFPHRYNQ